MPTNDKDEEMSNAKFVILLLVLFAASVTIWEVGKSSYEWFDKRYEWNIVAPKKRADQIRYEVKPKTDTATFFTWSYPCKRRD